MSEQTPINISNADFTFKDKYGNTGSNKGISTDDGTKLNNMVKLMNLILNTPNSADFINTLASKAYVDSEVNKAKKEIGESIFSLVPLQNAGYHLYDGALISGSGIYADFVAKIEELYTQHPEWNCWISESDWQTSVSTYGACGKFVVDTTNHTVRLPKVTGIVEGTIDANALGDLVEAGAPDINGTFAFHGGSYEYQNLMYTGGVDVTGAFGGQQIGQATVNVLQQAGYSDNYTKVTFNASQSNSIYGNSNTIQPQTIKGYYYIVLANVTKTEIQVDIDNVLTDLNSKADTDLSNVSNASQTFKDKSIEWGFPDYSYRIEITSDTFTPQVDGYLMGKLYQSGNIFMSYANMSIVELYQPLAGEQTMTSLIPVKKGQTYNIARSGQYTFVYFYSCLGAN